MGCVGGKQHQRPPVQQEEPGQHQNPSYHPMDSIMKEKAKVPPQQQNQPLQEKPEEEKNPEIQEQRVEQKKSINHNGSRISQDQKVSNKNGISYPSVVNKVPIEQQVKSVKESQRVSVRPSNNEQLVTPYTPMASNVQRDSMNRPNQQKSSIRDEPEINNKKPEGQMFKSQFHPVGSQSSGNQKMFSSQMRPDPRESIKINFLGARQRPTMVNRQSSQIRNHQYNSNASKIPVIRNGIKEEPEDGNDINEPVHMNGSKLLQTSKKSNVNGSSVVKMNIEENGRQRDSVPRQEQNSIPGLDVWNSKLLQLQI